MAIYEHKLYIYPEVGVRPTCSPPDFTLVYKQSYSTYELCTQCNYDMTGTTIKIREDLIDRVVTVVTRYPSLASYNVRTGNDLIDWDDTP